MMVQDIYDIPPFLRRGKNAVPKARSPSVTAKSKAKPTPPPVSEEDRLPSLPGKLKYATTPVEEAGFHVGDGIIPRRWADEDGVVLCVLSEIGRHAAARQERFARLVAIRDQAREERVSITQMKKEIKMAKLSKMKELVDQFNALARTAGKRERKQFDNIAAAEDAIKAIQADVSVVQQPAPGSDGPTLADTQASDGPALADTQTTSAEESDVAKKAKATKTKTTTKPKDGKREKLPKANAKFKPVRAGTARAKVIELSDGSRTVAQIASRIQTDERTVEMHLYMMWRDCNIGYSIADRKPSIIPPSGVKRASLVKAAAE